MEEDLRVQLDRAIESYWTAVNFEHNCPPNDCERAGREKIQARQTFDDAFTRYSEFLVGKITAQGRSKRKEVMVAVRKQ